MTGTEATIDASHPQRHRPRRRRGAGLAEVARALGEDAIAVDDLSLRQPTLDEVFLTLTGSRTR